MEQLTITGYYAYDQHHHRRYYGAWPGMDLPPDIPPEHKIRRCKYYLLPEGAEIRKNEYDYWWVRLDDFDFDIEFDGKKCVLKHKGCKIKLEEQLTLIV